MPDEFSCNSEYHRCNLGVHGRGYLVILGGVCAAVTGAMTGLVLSAWLIREFSR
jgi:hypothetical protein